MALRSTENSHKANQLILITFRAKYTSKACRRKLSFEVSSVLNSFKKNPLVSKKAV